MVMRRRQVLGTVLGGAAWAAVAGVRGGSSDAVADSLTPGFSLYGMKSLALSEAVEVCAETGYSHVEMVLNAGYPTEPSMFDTAARRGAAEQLRRLKLGLPALMVLMSLTADSEAHARSLEMIAVAGALGKELVGADQQPPVLETVLGGQPAKWESQKTGMLSQLKDWAAIAEKAGVVIAIKAHVGSAVNEPERLLWLLDEVKSPSIQVVYDYSHFQLQGRGLEETLRLLLPRIRLIHVKDSVGDVNKFRFVLPGEGRTDYVEYYSLLLSLGYGGPVCVEVSGQVFQQPGYDARAAARSCWAVLSGALKEARGRSVE